MENPLSWTPLHHEINKAYYSSTDGTLAVLKVLRDHNYDVTLDQVQAVVNRHKELLDLHFCGSSLPSMIIKELANQDHERL